MRSRIKKFNQFLGSDKTNLYLRGKINEMHKYINMLPVKDEKYQFLIDITKNISKESDIFYVKELIEIGTCGEHKLYLNYLSYDKYDDDVSFWVVYNEKPDKLYGTSWDSGVIWEEDAVLKYTEKHDFDLYPDFIDRIYKEIKSYPNLQEWRKKIGKMMDLSRKYHRAAIQNSYKSEEDRVELTWAESLEWTQNRIDTDKLLNRYSKPYDEKTLEEMLRLGEDEYNKVMKQRSNSINKIINKMKKDGELGGN